MRTFTKLIFIAVFGAFIVGVPLYCLSQKNCTEFIKEARDYIKQDDGNANSNLWLMKF